jgi:hypothetical protein
MRRSHSSSAKLTTGFRSKLCCFAEPLGAFEFGAARALYEQNLAPDVIAGAGFVYAPGTDASIKIGGYVTVEGTAKGAR